MTYPLFQIDAFANTPFEGNPAAVCNLENPADEAWMQSVAAEMNLAETAFVYPVNSTNNHYHLRWFTPTVEVPLCGHGTLATAHVLWNELGIDHSTPLRFDSLSGELVVHYADSVITLDFPASPPQPIETHSELISALGVDHGVCYQADENFLIEVNSADAVLLADPDFVKLATLAKHITVVTAASEDYDFVSRVFVPESGINEDPVTGAAHCILAPYWSDKLGKTHMKAKQVSKRGGELHLVVKGERVLISGQAITTLRGELDV